MRPLGPYDNIRLRATCTVRGLTLPMSKLAVQSMLPRGLVLGPQRLTSGDTHPVTMWFYDMEGMHMNIPSMMPNLAYNEHVLGIPYVYTVQSPLEPVRSGPFFYMATLRLNDWLAILGGRLFWGFEKNYSQITTTDRSFVVHSSGTDAPMVELDYEPVANTGYQPIPAYRHFKLMYELLQQPLISMVPASLGPMFMCSDFTRFWRQATLQPLNATVEIHEPYVRGLQPATHTVAPITESPMGAFSLKTEYACGLIYPTWFHPAPRAALAGAR